MGTVERTDPAYGGQAIYGLDGLTAGLARVFAAHDVRVQGAVATLTARR